MRKIKKIKVVHKEKVGNFGATLTNKSLDEFIEDEDKEWGGKYALSV